MEGNSWAEQWDYGHDDHKGKASGRNSATPSSYKQKVGEGLEKTKAVASGGFRKVKHGTSLGFNWVKDKCLKTTQKS